MTYLNDGGRFAMSIYWKNTAAGVVGGGSQHTFIPNSAFIPQTTPVGVAPLAPLNLAATAAAFNQINLTWTDNSNNETGFKIYRSLTNAGPFVALTTVPSNTTSYQDLSANGSTRYFYRITAYSDFGESGLSTQVPPGLAYSYFEPASMTSRHQLANLIPVKTGT